MLGPKEIPCPATQNCSKCRPTIPHCPQKHPLVAPQLCERLSINKSRNKNGKQTQVEPRVWRAQCVFITQCVRKEKQDTRLRRATLWGKARQMGATQKATLHWQRSKRHHPQTQQRLGPGPERSSIPNKCLSGGPYSSGVLLRSIGSAHSFHVGLNVGQLWNTLGSSDESLTLPVWRAKPGKKKNSPCVFFFFFCFWSSHFDVASLGHPGKHEFELKTIHFIWNLWFCIDFYCFLMLNECNTYENLAFS